MLTHVTEPDEVKPEAIHFQDTKGGSEVAIMQVLLTNGCKTDISYDIIPSRLGGSDLFRRLDCINRPGLTQEEFEGLLVKCQDCELIMTKRRVDLHECTGIAMRTKVVFVDLTQDD